MQQVHEDYSGRHFGHYVEQLDLRSRITAMRHVVARILGGISPAFGAREQLLHHPFIGARRQLQ